MSGPIKPFFQLAQDLLNSQMPSQCSFMNVSKDVFSQHLRNNELQVHFATFIRVIVSSIQDSLFNIICSHNCVKRCETIPCFWSCSSVTCFPDSLARRIGPTPSSESFASQMDCCEYSTRCAFAQGIVSWFESCSWPHWEQGRRDSASAFTWLLPLWWTILKSNSDSCSNQRANWPSGSLKFLNHARDPWSVLNQSAFLPDRAWTV